MTNIKKGASLQKWCDFNNLKVFSCNTTYNDSTIPRRTKLHPAVDEQCHRHKGYLQYSEERPIVDVEGFLVNPDTLEVINDLLELGFQGLDAFANGFFMVFEKFRLTVEHLRLTFLHSLFAFVSHLNLHRGLMCFDDSITDACNGIVNAFLGCIEGFYGIRGTGTLTLPCELTYLSL